MTGQPTLLAALLEDRGWQRYGTFRAAYEKAARSLDRQHGGSAPSRAQFHRWLTGDLRSLPYTDHCRVLEHMLTGYSVGQLFKPCPNGIPAPRSASSDDPSSAPQTPTADMGTADIAAVFASRSLLTQIIPLLQAADLPSDTGDTRDYTSPYAALDAILSRARSLIFEFDGPICDLSAAMPLTTADQLRATLRTHAADVPPAPAITGTDDPFDILERAAAISIDLGGRIDSQLTDIEVQAVAKAMPSAYVHETLAACRDSGRSAAVISRHSARAVTAYLDTHSLADQVRVTAAPAAYPPGHLQTAPHLIEEVTQTLYTRPANCAVITATASGIQAARTIGAMSIGYATTLAASESLTSSGAGCAISSLADLTLRLRARPLPN